MFLVEHTHDAGIWILLLDYKYTIQNPVHISVICWAMYRLHVYNIFSYIIMTMYTLTCVSELYMYMLYLTFQWKNHMWLLVFRWKTPSHWDWLYCPGKPITGR